MFAIVLYGHVAAALSSRLRQDDNFQVEYRGQRTRTTSSAKSTQTITYLNGVKESAIFFCQMISAFILYQYLFKRVIGRDIHECG